MKFNLLLILFFPVFCFGQNFQIYDDFQHRQNGNKIGFDSVSIEFNSRDGYRSNLEKNFKGICISALSFDTISYRLNSMLFDLDTNYNLIQNGFEKIETGHPKFNRFYEDWRLKDSLYQDSIQTVLDRKWKRFKDSFYRVNGYHYPSPGSNVLDGVYVVKKTFHSPIYEYKSVKHTQLMEPFILKSQSVTNKEYKEFVYWVRDSIARELLYDKCEDTEVFTDMLTYPKSNVWFDENSLEQVEVDPTDKMMREIFNLNWDFKFRYDDKWVVPLLNEMYLPTSKRYYVQRQFDVRQFTYKYTEIKNDSIQLKEVNIYPDTLGFVRLDSMNNSKGKMDVYTNMYFWHNAYDNYPVVNVSYHQIQAFLNWKSRQLNSALKLKNQKVVLELPKMSEIEMVLIREKGTQLNHLFNLNERILENSDATKLLPSDDPKVDYIRKSYPKSKELQYLGWNVSEFSQTTPGNTAGAILNQTWSDSAKLIYGSNWVLRNKKFQGKTCTNAVETTDLVEDHALSKPYLGFRYTIRLVPNN